MEGVTTAQIIGAAITGGATLGLSIAAGQRLIPYALDSLLRAPGSRQKRPDLSSPARGSKWGPARDTQIRFLESTGIIGLDDGYCRGWDASPINSRLSEDDVLDGAVDRVARMLASTGAAGTVIQIRQSRGPDPGRAVYEQLMSRGQNTDPVARELSSIQNEHILASARRGAFQQSRLSVWARVPKQTKRRVPNPLASAKAIIAQEREARDKAAASFDAIKRMMPLRMRELGGEATWSVLYKGHNKGVTGVPNFLRHGAENIQYALCANDLHFCDGGVVVDGRIPVAVVSLKTAPSPGFGADLHRIMETPAMGFPHTIIAEYEVLDQETSKRRLRTRIRQADVAGHTLKGTKNLSPESDEVISDLRALLKAVVGGKDKLIAARYYAVVEAPPVNDPRDESELAESKRILDDRCNQIIETLKVDGGAEAIRESQAAVEEIYPLSIVGELRPCTTGRELTEATSTVAALAPVEAPWGGTPGGPTVIATNTGRLLNINLWDRRTFMSPTVIITAGSGGGKSFLLGEFIQDGLGNVDEMTVHCVDIGKSQGPLADILGAHKIEFNVGDRRPRPYGIWGYPGITERVPPDEVQVEMVVGDVMNLAGRGDQLTHDLLTNLVIDVYKDEVPRNGPGKPKHEPTLSHLLNKLRTQGPALASQPLRDLAAELSNALEQFRDHPWLDRPTDPSFEDNNSRFKWYELGSLDGLPRAVQNALAYRVACRVGTSGGTMGARGQYTPTLLCFDEGHKIKESYPVVFKALESIARMGRKEGVVQIIATQAWTDLSDCPAIIRNSSLRLIGTQNSYDPAIARDCGLSKGAEAAIASLKTSPGEFSQFLAVVGHGPHQIVEILQHEVSPTILWARTTESTERNARTEVLSLVPEWDTLTACRYLASVHPKGLAAEGLTRPDTSRLKAERPRARAELKR